MGRVRTLTGVTAAVLCAAAGPGCATVTSATTAVTEAVTTAAPPQPASQLVCLWQRRLAPLPDPVRDGSQRFGLPGQMFLLTPSGTPADMAGDLTVVVYDETQRPQGRPPRTAEVWHFTADKLRQMRTADERFGPSTALFLPWVDGWQDVTAVRILARYDAKNQPTLYAGEVKLTLDLSAAGAPVWNDVGTGPPAGGAPQQASFDARSVPDPAKMLKAAQAGWNPPQPPPFPAAGTVPLHPPQQWPVNQPVFPQMPTPPGAAVPGPVQPVLMPR